MELPILKEIPRKKRMKEPTNEEIQKKFEKCFHYNQQVGLYETCHVNENFFIGNQWEGVESNGNPTPTMNMLKRVVLFQVSTISSDNMAINCTPLPSVSPFRKADLERICDIINKQFAFIMERNRIVTKARELLRDAAVRGDGCMYFYFDPSVENGQSVKGEIVAEVLENTRVHFGNPNCRDVQRQPYIIISRRELIEDVRLRAEDLAEVDGTEITDPESIRPDSEKFQNKFDSFTDDKVTVLSYFYRNRDTGTIWMAESTEAGLLKKAVDTGYSLYPLVWLNWDYIHDNYHGQAMITGLIPNQKFINKMFAMVGVSLMTSAFPTRIYDKNRIRNWDPGVGRAIGVNGNVGDAVATVDGAPVNPQIAQFMEMCIDKTQTFLGATNVALGDSRPDNTSARRYWHCAMGVA